MLEKIDLFSINLFSCGSEGRNIFISVFEFTEIETSYAITEIVGGYIPSKDKELFMLMALSTYSPPITSRFWRP